MSFSVFLFLFFSCFLEQGTGWRRKGSEMFEDSLQSFNDLKSVVVCSVLHKLQAFSNCLQCATVLVYRG